MAKMIYDYREVMVTLWKQSVYTESDIKQFQLNIDNFFTSYIEESGAGNEGVTDYTHLLGSLIT